MKNVQVLYFEGCPNHRPTVEMISEIVEELGIEARVEEREVELADNAEELRFLGSPTVLVDGVDIEPAARSRTDFGFSCRTYNGHGMPSRETVVAALTDGYSMSQGSNPGQQTSASTDCCSTQPSDAEDARQTAGPRRQFLASFGAVFLAIAGSACCWLPLTLLAFGVTAGGIGAAIVPWRPYLLAFSGVMLATGFYMAYRRAPGCQPGSACDIKTTRLVKINRIVLWAATGVAIAFGLFPYYSGFLLQNEVNATASEAGGDVITMKIDGMTCQGCAAHLQAELQRVPGVNTASVDFSSATATIVPNAESPPSRDALADAVEAARYTVDPKDQLPADSLSSNGARRSKP